MKIMPEMPLGTGCRALFFPNLQLLRYWETHQLVLIQAAHMTRRSTVTEQLQRSETETSLLMSMASAQKNILKSETSKYLIKHWFSLTHKFHKEFINNYKKRFKRWADKVLTFIHALFFLVGFSQFLYNKYSDYLTMGSSRGRGIVYL